MTAGRLSIVFLGLSLSSSWGNGHATTYRALLRGLAERGHELLFLERDVPWYAAHRDLRDPVYCRLELYADLRDLADRHGRSITDADVVIVGSYVPDGADVLRLVLATAGGVVGFYDIDTPVTLAALGRGDCAYLEPGQVPALALYFSFSGGAAITRLRQLYGARLPLPLHCMADEELYRPTGGPIRWDLGYLGTYSADRQPALERLLIEPALRLPDRRFVVAGPQYPDTIAWPANVDRIEHVAPEQHPAFYGSLRYALNITRADMLELGHSPSVRLFEASACATPLVTDRWAGLGEFFPEGEAIIVADDSSDVVAALAAGDPTADRRIAERARAITLSGHTGRHRAAEFEHGVRRALEDIASETNRERTHHGARARA